MLKTPDSDKVKQILKISTPCIAEQLLMFSVSIVSIAVIGHLGSGELVAAAMTNTIVNWLQSIYTGLASGGTVVIARIWGSGDKQGAKKSFMQTLIIAVTLSTAILLITMTFQKQLVLLFFGNAHNDILDKINIYFFYSMIGMPATAVTTVINAGVRGAGDNKTPFFTTAVLNIINLVLSLILIHGMPSIGIPSMGIAGAGIAISCARYAGMIFSILITLYKKSPILPGKLTIRLEKDIIARILKIGFPSMLEQLIFNGGFVILQAMLIGFGTAFQGGYQIGANLNGLTNAPVLGLSVAVTVLISHALGKRDFEQADEIVRISRFLTIGVFVLLGLMLFIFAPVITRIYTSDHQVLKSGTFFARVFGILLIPIAYFQIMAAILRGSGDVRYVAVTSIIGLWVMRIFVVWLIGRLSGNGYIAVVIGLSLDFVLRAFMYHVRVRKGKWKYIRI